MPTGDRGRIQLLVRVKTVPFCLWFWRSEEMVHREAAGFSSSGGVSLSHSEVELRQFSAEPILCGHLY